MMIHRAADSLVHAVNPSLSLLLPESLVFPLVKKLRRLKDQRAIRRGECSRDTVLFKVSVNLFIGGSVTLLM